MKADGRDAEGEEERKRETKTEATQTTTTTTTMSRATELSCCKTVRLLILFLDVEPLRALRAAELKRHVLAFSLVSEGRLERGQKKGGDGEEASSSHRRQTTTRTTTDRQRSLSCRTYGTSKTLTDRRRHDDDRRTDDKERADTSRDVMGILEGGGRPPLRCRYQVVTSMGFARNIQTPPSSRGDGERDKRCSLNCIESNWGILAPSDPPAIHVSKVPTQLAVQSRVPPSDLEWNNDGLTMAQGSRWTERRQNLVGI